MGQNVIIVLDSLPTVALLLGPSRTSMQKRPGDETIVTYFLLPVC